MTWKAVLPRLLDDVLLPTALAVLTAALSGAPSAPSIAFFVFAEWCADFWRVFGPMPRMARHIFAPVVAPSPAFVLVWAVFDDPDILEVGMAVVHYFVFLCYSAVLRFFVPLTSAVVGGPEHYPED